MAQEGETLPHQQDYPRSVSSAQKRGRQASTVTQVALSLEQCFDPLSQFLQHKVMSHIKAPEYSFFFCEAFDKPSKAIKGYLGFRT